jgi:CheY-like chemotaxis protein
MTYSILYVEDNADNMRLVRRALEARGYAVHEAVNGMEGLEKAKAVKPNLILLDINLPDIDGYEVARQLRSVGGADLHYTPIIAITANALKGDAEKALTAGCDVYMAKPINVRELWARIEAFLPEVAE